MAEKGAKIGEAEIELARTEVYAFSQFVNSSLAPNSYVRRRCHDLLNSLQNDIDTVQTKAKQAKLNFTLKIQANVGNSVSSRNLEIVPDATLADLKAAVEKQMNAGYPIDRIKVKRTGRAWGEFDSKPLATCEIVNGDELVVDFKTAVQPIFNYDKSLRGLRRVCTSAVHPVDAFELLAVTAHCFLLDLDFICVVEHANATPGFAPSIRGESISLYFDSMRRLLIIFVPQSFLRGPCCLRAGIPRSLWP